MKLREGKKYKLKSGRWFVLSKIDLFGMAHVKFPEDREELEIRAELLAEEAEEVHDDYRGEVGR